jgi:copper transport protein
MTCLIRRLVLILCLALWGGAAAAHAVLLSSDPAAEAVLDAPPEAVTLRFNEAVAPLSMNWLLPDGSQTPATVTAQGEVLLIAPPGTETGSYVLSWRVASTDGHPVSGALVFAIGAPSLSGAPTTGPGVLVWAGAVLRGLIFVTLALAAGGAALAALTGPAPLRTARLSALALLPLCGMAFVLHHLDRGSGAVTATLGSPYGLTLALSVLAGMLALQPGRGWGLSAWVVAALAFGASGHARTAAGSGLALAALHGLALSFWIGGLPLLLSPDAERLRRFSNIALPMVVLLIGSGAAMTLALVPEPAALLAHPWGLVLATKLALVAVMLVLALRNRQALTPALAAGDATAAPRLTRTIRAEIALGLGVLALAALFRVTGPPVLPAPPQDAYIHIHSAEVMVDLTASPGAPGPVTLTLGFADGAFAALTPVAARLDLTDPARGIGPIRVEAAPGPDGLWTAGPVTLPTTGPWRVEIAIRITDFRQVTLTGDLSLAPPP